MRAFMSRNHELRALSCSTWPLLAIGTNIRIKDPVIMPNTGETWKRCHAVKCIDETTFFYE